MADDSQAKTSAVAYRDAATGNRAVGVLGAGVMGKAIAYRFAKFGHDVMLVDHDQTVLDKAPQDIRNIGRHDRLMTGTSPNAERLDGIARSTSLYSLKAADIVIENITEDRAAKTAVYQRLGAILHPKAIVAVNTSTLPIGELADIIGGVERVIGAHFMNPVYLKDTVEMIVGQRTSPGTIETTEQLLASCGMTAIVVHDRAGFVINRVLMVAINEAIRCLEEGVADARSIDQLFERCLGHAMGPLATGDLIGLDTIKLSLDRLHEAYGEAKYVPTDKLVEMVKEGRLGRKSGAGFFSYRGDQ